MAKPLLAQKRFYLTYAIYWVLWIVIETNVLQWYGMPGLQSLYDSLITFVLLAVVCVLVCNLLTYYEPSRDVILYLSVLAVVSTLVWGFVDRAILQGLLYGGGPYEEMLSGSMPVRLCIGFLNIGWMILITLFWKRLETERDARDRQADMERNSKDAELYKLRQQLSPHFLFNSLNSINALIHSKPDQARKMVQQLSEFLRGTLKREEYQMITLEEELQYLRLYLDIERVRFGHRLNARFDNEPASLEAMIPPLILQPLMENAIKFGLYGTTGEVTISLRSRMVDQYLVIAIVNPYEADMQTNKGTGFGLKSIRRRLYLLYGRDDLMEITQDTASFVVAFRIPQRYE
jgi:hypothetical protein